MLAEIFGTWTPQDGGPKIHLSSEAAGGPAAGHPENVDVADLIAVMRVAPNEAKEKDRALLRLHDELKTRDY